MRSSSQVTLISVLNELTKLRGIIMVFRVNSAHYEYNNREKEIKEGIWKEL